MAWIESHQELQRHPKTRRLTRLLNISLPAAIGHLHCLWWWCLDFAQEGDLSTYTREDIAEAALWVDDPGVFMDALVQAGFLDQVKERGLSVHDWNDYAGRLFAARRAQREAGKKGAERRWHTATDGNPNGVPNGVRIGSDSTVPNRNPTVPNRTVPNPTKDERTSAPRSSAPAKKGEKSERSERTPALTDEMRGKLHTRYDALLTAEGVNECIGQALKHPSAQKYASWDEYVANWLRREVPRMSAAPPRQSFAFSGSSRQEGILTQESAARRRAEGKGF